MRLLYYPVRFSALVRRIPDSEYAIVSTASSSRLRIPSVNRSHQDSIAKEVHNHIISPTRNSIPHLHVSPQSERVIYVVRRDFAKHTCLSRPTKWRETALSTLWLWTITPPLPRSKPFIQAPSLTRAFYDTMMARSKDALLELFIQLENMSPERPGHAMLFEIVTSHARRWGLCVLSAPWMFLIRHIGALIDPSTPQ